MRNSRLHFGSLNANNMQTNETNKIFYSSITRLAVHKQSILNLLRQKGRRVRKAYWQ